jgi:hypothetical protein
MSELNQPESKDRSEADLELERLIRTSIASYGEPARDSELTRRILAQIATEPPRLATLRLLRWVVALPIAACLIAAIALFELRLGHAPGNLADRAHVVAPPTNDSPVGLAQTPPHQSPREKRPTAARNGAQRELTFVMAEKKTHPLPKLDVFPTPQPLTPAERALIQFVTSAPNSEGKPTIEAPKQADMPVTIAAIKIQPIEMPDLGN